MSRSLELAVQLHVLANLPLAQALRCAELCQAWRYAARRPESLRSPLVLRVSTAASASSDVGVGAIFTCTSASAVTAASTAPAVPTWDQNCEAGGIGTADAGVAANNDRDFAVARGLKSLLTAGCFRLVETVELQGVSDWCADVISQLGGIRHLRVCVLCCHDDAESAAARCVRKASPRLEHLDLAQEGLTPRPFAVPPSLPRSLRVLRLRNWHLTLDDVSTLLSADGLLELEIASCQLLLAVQPGVVHRAGSQERGLPQPRRIAVLFCGTNMALTLLLSIDLGRLEVLRIDAASEAGLCQVVRRLQPPVLPVANDPTAELWDRAEAELRAELRRDETEACGGAQRGGAKPWRQLQRFLDVACRRELVAAGEVSYELTVPLDMNMTTKAACK